MNAETRTSRARSVAVAMLYALSIVTLLALSPLYRGRFGTETLGLFAVVAALLVWAAASIDTRILGSRTAVVMTSTIAILTVWMALGCILSDAKSTSVDAVLKFSALPLGFVIAASSRDSAARFGLLAGSVALIVAWACHAAYQFFGQAIPPMAVFQTQNSYAAVLDIGLLAVCGLLLGAARGNARSVQGLLWGIAVFLAYSLGLTSSRGAFLAALAGYAIILLTAYLMGSARRAGVVILVLIGATLVGGQTTTLMKMHAPTADTAEPVNASARPEPLLARIAIVADEEQTLRHRTVIWKAAVRMIAAAPLFGTGPGTFWLVYPRYREASDASRGTHVHNDYLEYGVELGMLGLLLLALLPAATLLQGRRTLVAARRQSDSSTAFLSAGLVGGIVAVFVHSVVDFNMYIMPTLLLTGLWLGLQTALACKVEGLQATDPLSPSELLPPQRAAAVVAALGLLFLVMLPQAFASFHYERAFQPTRSDQGHEIVRNLEVAMLFAPAREVVPLAAAHQYLRLMDARKQSSGMHDATGFHRARELLLRAEQLNPLRADTPFMLAGLYAANAQLAGSRWREDAEALYRQALARNPSLLSARIGLLRLLMDSGRDREALEVAEGGIGRFGPESRDMVTLIGVGAELRARTGNAAGALELARQVDEVLAGTGATSRYAERLAVKHPDVAALRALQDNSLRK